MASGKLGSAAPLASTNTSIYTVPAGKVATLSISMVNRGTTSATFNVAIAPLATPVLADYVEYGETLRENGGVFNRTGFVCGPGEIVVVWCSSANASVRVEGFEEVAS